MISRFDFEIDFFVIRDSTQPYFILYLQDKLMLEPYGKPRDVAYVIVAPDNDYILQHVLGFFKELSTTYEACRLGKHRPLSRTLRDGVLRVGKSAASKLADQQVQLEWFNLIGMFFLFFSLFVINFSLICGSCFFLHNLFSSPWLSNS